MSNANDRLKLGEAIMALIEQKRAETGDESLGANIERVVLESQFRELEDEMQRASANLEFERAALLRDQIMEVKSGTGLSKIERKRRPVKYTRNNGRRRSRV